MFYLLAVLINVSNFNPVVAKDCVELNHDKAKSELEKTAIDMMNSGFACEKNQETLVYNCQNLKAGVIAKVVLMKNKKECSAFPKKLAADLKTLMGK